MDPAFDPINERSITTVTTEQAQQLIDAAPAIEGYSFATSNVLVESEDGEALGFTNIVLMMFAVGNDEHQAMVPLHFATTDQFRQFIDHAIDFLETEVDKREGRAGGGLILPGGGS